MNINPIVEPTFHEYKLNQSALLIFHLITGIYNVHVQCALTQGTKAQCKHSYINNQL